MSTNKNVNDIWNVTRKPSSKNANGIPDRGQQMSVMALKLAVFLFHIVWLCTFDYKVKGVWKDIVHFFAGQKIKRQV